MVIHLRGSLARSVKAGDNVTVSGIFLPEPYTGQRQVRQLSVDHTLRLAGDVAPGSGGSGRLPASGWARPPTSPPPHLPHTHADAARLAADCDLR